MMTGYHRSVLKKREKQYRDRVPVACCAYVWCVCVCVLDLEGNWVVASRALAVYLFLTGYNDCLVGFHGPLSPPSDDTQVSKMSCAVTAA